MDPRILLYYACGLFAAAQLGKLAALAPLISRELQLGLAAMAALTSLLEVCGALLGGVAGRWLPRLGLRRGLSLAVVSLSAGAAGSAFAQDVALLAMARLLESVGYLGVVVAAPVLIAHAAHGRRQAAAMALWSTFLPAGMAIGAWAFSQAATVAGWRAAQGLSVAAGVLIWLALSLTRDDASPVSEEDVRAAPGPTGAVLWSLVIGFGIYAVAEVGLLALLPSLLTQGGMALTLAGTWTAAAALANVPASAAGAWLLRRHGALSPAIAGGLLLSLLISGLVYPAVMRDAGAPALQAPLAVVINLASGVFPCLVFALLPLAAGSPARMSLASGRLTQFGASGALLGPPLMGAVVEHWGWTAAGGLSLVLSIAAIPFALIGWRRLASHAAPASPSLVRREP